ncbi:GDP-mannose 4,6-dehydratase [Kallotenue papyrolyticum]|uniref:GDP-mannose 4,6-dehydratase n=1 Tax=Kallotenue papyrolyticum TaxID=1325125 RepID=UPI0004927A33|nr:GDP-mannose 4,6-dehydratase [Kallotenue papyrolyticum]
MRALITGINGFVGGHLAEHLLAATDWQLFGVTREPALALPALRGRVTPLVADLLDAAAVRHVVREARPEVVFHLAAQAHTPTSFRDPAGTLTGNILMQLHLFEAIRAAELDPLILVVGTGEEYGAVRPDELPVNEQTPLRPVSPYAVSKAAQDLLAFQYHAAYGLRTIRVRPFNHTGPRQEDRYAPTAFAHQIARIEAGLQAPVVRVGNLEAQRDFTDVRDMVRAYHLAVLHGQPGEVYNLGSGRAVPIRAILEQLLALSTVPIQVEPDAERMRPADVPLIVCDATRFRERTGWQPQIPLAQTLRDILEDFRARVRGAG